MAKPTVATKSTVAAKKRSLLKTIVQAMLLIGLFAALFFFVLMWIARSVPTSYATLIGSEPLETVPLEDFEQQFLELRNATRRVGNWSADFSAPAINKWLAVDLKRKFAASIPAGLSEPRLQLLPERVWIGVAVSNRWFQGVLSTEAKISLTDKPNQFALNFLSLKVGNLPLPVGWFESLIRQVVAKQNISSFWVDSDEGRVLLCDLPRSITLHDDGAQLLLQQFEIIDGKLSVSGMTTRAK
jgi:hypothetical protein